MIGSLKLEGVIEHYEIKELELTKLNIFVGKNNSGKSRFIRKLLDIKNDDYIIKNTNLIEYPNHLYNLEDLRYLSLDSTKLTNLKKIIEGKEWLNLKFPYKRLLEEKQMYAPDPTRDTDFGNGKYSNTERQKIMEYLNQIKVDKWEDDKLLEKVYIPILRGMRGIGEEDFYKARTMEDYFTGKEEEFKKERLDIWTGLEVYRRCKSMLLGNSKQRKNINEFQKFLSEEFFENEEVVLMPMDGEIDLHIKIGEEKDFPIFDLGDGIQSMIILTFPLFENLGKNVLLGIEEPEIYLHPGVQRKLMEILLDKDKKYDFESFQYLITTHSNHFLDLTLDYPEDVIVYESKKIEDSKFEVIRKNDENILGLMDSLGIRNSSVFLANSTIWVEGITDRLYLKEYIKIYQNYLFDSGDIKKIYEEDKHYSFVEYSGGNITHWDFLDEEEGMASGKISNKIFLIADTDGQVGTGSRKEERIKILKEKLGLNFYALEAREIENILTPQIIKKVVLTKEENNTKVDITSLKDIEFIQSDYKEEGIGSYIEDVLKNIRVNKHRKYEADSGTIHEKVKFCRLACDNIKSMEDLSEEAKIICEKLYDFIARANGDRA